MRSRIGILLLALLWIVPATQAQQCGVADSFNYPIDTQTFQLVQDFAARSPRHQGRFHTGEDWYAGRADNYGIGQPVRAAAAGRVTFSSPIGWGRDGGVVIIEHTFRDGSILYTHYGHMMETDTARFPRQWTCVPAGEVIGAVGNVRPAPHLHFEVRAVDGTSPGPGYSWGDPFASGWRQPVKAVRNWQTWLLPAYRWRLDVADEAGPIAPLLELDDHSLLYLDANRLGRVTPDGRSLWRINLERRGIALTSYEVLPLLTYADGVMQRVNLDGSLSDRWETGLSLAQPVLLGDLLVFQTPSSALVALGPDRREVRWRLEDVPPVWRAQPAGQVIGLMTRTNEMLTLSLDGQLLDRAQLHEPGSLAVDPNGELHAYTVGGLWTILADGTWAEDLDNAPDGGQSSAVLYAPNGDLYLFDGRVLHAYDAQRAARWQVQLPDSIGGQVRLDAYGGVLLLTSNHGDILALEQASGGLCGFAQIFGNDRAQFWYSLGVDGRLRVAVSDQILGLDWATFLGGCAG
jgi:hypothetical protein